MNRRGFTILEIIIALTILGMVMVGVVRAYSYMLATNRTFADSLNFQNYSQYVGNLLQVVDVSSEPINTPFYIKFNDPSTVAISHSSTDKQGDLNFFPNKNDNYSHEFRLVGTGAFNGIIYYIYSLDTTGPNNQNQKTYVTK